MKKYFINGSITTKRNFEKELLRCFTKSERLAAGASNGITDNERLAEVTEKLNKGWSFRCVYAPAQLDLEFKIKEVQK